MLEQRISVLEIVAIAVVEGKADEATVIAFLQALHGFIERDHVEVRFLHLIEHGIEELRRDLENAIGGAGVRLLGLGPHMVQREDHAGALRIRGQQAMRACVIEPRHKRGICGICEFMLRRCGMR